jgi:SAM-dependent methyltransferase
MDWDAGDYSKLSADLAPASDAIVEALAAPAGATFLDVACGDGNLSLAAARAGLRITGSDLAPGLVEKAKARLAAEGFEAEWAVADAQDLPFADGAFDAAGSAFGAIFAAEGHRAVAELQRVVRPGGTVAITAWVPEGPIAEWITLARGVAAEYQAPPPGDAPRPVAWHERDVLAQAFGPGVEVSDHTLTFGADSADAWIAEQRELHPAWLSMQEAIPANRFAELVEEARRMFNERNEDPGGFRVSSPYVVARAEVG